MSSWNPQGQRFCPQRQKWVTITRERFKFNKHRIWKMSVYVLMNLFYNKVHTAFYPITVEIAKIKLGFRFDISCKVCNDKPKPAENRVRQSTRPKMSRNISIEVCSTQYIKISAFILLIQWLTFSIKNTVALKSQFPRLILQICFPVTLKSPFFFFSIFC